MLTEFSYPMICTEKFAETVAFYEDNFEFVPAFEIDGFSILKREDRDGIYLAVIDAGNKAVPEPYKSRHGGIILNFPVVDVDAVYEQFYMEGLDIVSKPDVAVCGRKHFFVADPNGTLIDVAQNVPLESILSADELENLRIVVSS